MAEVRPAFFDVTDWLEGICSTKSFPPLQIDFVEAEGKCLSIVQTTTAVTEKEYINGSRICRMEFDILAQGSVADRLDLITDLTELTTMFEVCRDEVVSDNRRILRATATVPSLRNQMDNGTVQYGISVSLTYKEF